MFKSLLLCVFVAGFTLGKADYGRDDCITKEDFRSLMEEQEMRLRNHENIYRQQAQLINALTARLDELEKPTIVNTSIRKRQIEEPVALTATIHQLNENHLGQHQAIVFPDIVTNVGGATYHDAHGVFTVPRSGLYLISTTLLTTYGERLAASIKINGKAIINMYEKGTVGDHGSASQTVAVQLNKGDDVSIESHNSDQTVWGDNYSSLTIVLLYETLEGPPIVG